MTRQNQDQEASKAQIVEALERWLHRDGSQSLIQWLTESNDFFSAPASTRYHGSFPGGLAKHSFHTYCILQNKVEDFGLEYSAETVVICGLLHDVCKCDTYKMGARGYFVKDHMPLGHGEKSVFLLQKHVDLTDEEAIAIRFHMGVFESGLSNKNFPTSFAFQEAMNIYPLVILLHTADLEATYLLDTKAKGGR